VKAAVTVKVEEAPTAIDEGLAEISTVAGPDELLT
jgi:hypothetical protein